VQLLRRALPTPTGGTVGDDASELIEKYRDVFPSHESLITFDPPLHADHRGLMMRLLTPKRLKENEDFMWRLADQLIDGFAANGRCDFIAEYAQPFSLLVIADLLGVPESDHAELRGRMVAKGPAGAVGQQMQGNFLAHLEDFFTAYIEARRREPQDDVLGKMAQATFADGSMPEVHRGRPRGHDPLRRGAGNGGPVLGQHPEDHRRGP
jgi:cytochrome P450